MHRQTICGRKDLWKTGMSDRSKDKLLTKRQYFAVSVATRHKLIFTI